MKEVNEKLPQLQFTADDVYNASVEYFEGDTLAASVFRDKYALRDNKVLSQSGVDNPAAFVESTPDEMHNRIAQELARIDKNYENGKSFSEYRNAIDKFKYVVPQGSPMYGIGNPFVNVSLSNCVVVESPNDSVSGIFDTGKQMANLFKARCGVGVSLDTLRPESAYVNNSAGSSTGAWSFAEYFSNVGRMIGQNGRRAAEMLTMSVLHPDIDKFIIMKRDLSKVTGANISVMLTDEFMESVEKSENFYARFPIEDTPENIMSEGGEWVVMEPDLSKNRPIRSKRWVSSNPKSKKCLVEFNAADLWRLINESAVMSAEPGLIFWDNYKKNLPADFYPNFKSQCVNPCVTGDTLVAVADGRGQVPFSELAETGDDVPVYTKDNDGHVAVRMMRAPRKTACNQKIFKVNLSNGESLRVTEQHRFILKNNAFVAACDLKPNDSLSILSRYEATSEQSGLSWMKSKQDYIWISSGKTKRRGEHRLIAEFYNNTNLKNSKDLVVHHIDFNSKNNIISNLEIMDNETHNTLHSSQKIGHNNPMFIALNGGWTKERVNEYKQLQSEKASGENNSRYLGKTNEQIRCFAKQLTLKLGYRFSYNDWVEFAKTNNLPVGFSGWRTGELGGITALAKWAANEVGIESIDADPRVQKTFINLLAQGYDAFMEGGVCKVNKKCSICDNSFIVDASRRATCLCSRNCAAILASRQPGRMDSVRQTKNKTNHINANKQMVIFNLLQTELGRTPKAKEWESACKNQNTPYRIGKASGTFRTFNDLKEQASMYNHTVVSVEFDGFEDVYNGTVDEFHNYYIGGFEEKTIHGKRKQVFVNTVNCSEIALSPLDSCRLTSTNLKGFVVNKFTTEAYFDFVKFEEMVRLGQRIMDNIVDLEIECLENIKEKCKDDKDEFELWSGLQNAAIRGRRTGFGMHALADTLACLGLRYDSDEALEMARKISESFRDTAYDESVNLAIERGAFPDFNWEFEKDCDFIKRLPQKIQDRIKKYGRRNISLLTVAPTGSTSIVCRTSSGLEPVFSNYFTRRKKINPSDPIHRVDFTDQNGDKWQEYAVFHYNVQDYLNTNSVAMAQWKEIEATIPPAQWSEKINEIIPDYFVTAPDIDGSRRVEIQGIITSYIDHGISSTINLPKGTTVEQVEKLYMLAWKHGLKGVTVYVDGSRSGVLVNFSESKDPTTEIVESKCPKRPKELPCDIHHIKVDGIDWVAFVGLLNGVPYEIFGGAKEQVDIPKKIKQGKIAKRKCEKVNAKGRTACYDLIIGEDDDEWKIKDVAVSFENGNYAAQTRMISLSLRHGVPAQFVAEQLSRDFESDFHSFSRVMARVLKQYVSDGATGSEKCSSCGDKLRFENGCASCPNCGSSKCN